MLWISLFAHDQSVLRVMETLQLAGPRGSDGSKLSSALPLPSQAGHLEIWILMKYSSEMMDSNLSLRIGRSNGKSF